MVVELNKEIAHTQKTTIKMMMRNRVIDELILQYRRNIFRSGK